MSEGNAESEDDSSSSSDSDDDMSKSEGDAMSLIRDKEVKWLLAVASQLGGNHSTNVK